MNATIIALSALFFGCAAQTASTMPSWPKDPTTYDFKSNLLQPGYMIVMAGKGYGEPSRDVAVGGKRYSVVVLDDSLNNPVTYRIAVTNVMTGSITGVEVMGEKIIYTHMQGDAMLFEDTLVDVLREWAKTMPVPSPEPARRYGTPQGQQHR